MSRADEPRRTQRTVTPGNITVAQSEELLRQRQRQTGRPWSQRANRLFGDPGRGSWLLMGIAAFAVIFNGLISVARLTPLLGQQTDAQLISSILGTALLPVGMLFAWAAARLRIFAKQVDSELDAQPR